MTHSQDKNTKTRILDAAFSFYSEPCFTNISLSAIAQRAGITKAGIFRHFKNKETLLDAMRSRYFDDVRAVISGHAEAFPELLTQIVALIRGHEEYMFYTLYQYIADPSFEARMFVELKKRGADLKSYGICSGVTEDGSRIIIQNRGEYFKLLYEIATTIYFLNNRTCGHSPTEGEDTADPVEWLNKVFRSGISDPSKRLTSERRGEIDVLCALRAEEMPSVDPFFDALSEVIRKKGFPGTTIESIAGELGLAKSSLYTYFKNKDELIVTLVERELVHLVTILKQKAEMTRSVDERGYIIMRTMLEYYLQRPSVVSVTAWLRMRGSFMFDSVLDKAEINIVELLKQKETTIGMPMTRQKYYGWLHILVTTIFCQSLVNGFSLEDCSSAITVYYTYIQKGVYSDEEI
jgi:Transcriptional regulator